MNVALTHRVGDLEPDLHTWEGFTIEALRVVSAKSMRVAWLVLGDFASDVGDLVPIDNPLHRRLENAHPRAGRADRSTLAKAPPFAAVSRFLESDPMLDWNL